MTAAPETPLSWFNEARKRWIAVCPLRRCAWAYGSQEGQEHVEHVAGLHAAICPGR